MRTRARLEITKQVLDRIERDREYYCVPGMHRKLEQRIINEELLDIVMATAVADAAAGRKG